MPSLSHYSKKQCFYCDELSEEPSTHIVKRKYKLAGHRRRDSLDQLGIKSYIYFTTTSKTHHPPDTTLEVAPHEIAHYVHKPLRHKNTFIDIRYRERIFEDALQIKVNDPANGFRKVGKLSDAKWSELQSMAQHVLTKRMSDEAKKDVLYGLLEADVAEQFITDWGLA